MSDGYEFWRAQLAGGSPECVVGKPGCGFYENIFRKSEPNPSPGVGKPRRKIRHIPQVLAIWRDADWHCRIDTPEGVSLIEGLERVENIFATICRKAISFETYTQRTRDYEQQRCNTGREAVAATGERREDRGDSSADHGRRLSAG